MNFVEGDILALLDLMEFTLKVIVAILMIIFAPILITSGVAFVASLAIDIEWVIGEIAPITCITMLTLVIVVSAAAVTDE